MTNLSIKSCRNVLNNSKSTHHEIIEALNALEINDTPAALDVILSFLEKSLWENFESHITKHAISSLRFNCDPIKNLDSRKKDILKSYCQSTTDLLHHQVLELLKESWEEDDLPFLEALEFKLNTMAQKLHVKALNKLNSTKTKKFILQYKLN